MKKIVKANENQIIKKDTMSKLYISLTTFAILFTASYASAQPAPSNPPLNITESDGSPSTYPYKLKVSNGSLTDNGDGTVTLTTSGGGSGGSTDITLTGWTRVGTRVKLVTSTDQVGIGTSTPANNIQMQTTGSVALATSSGNVGIGITSPQAALDVQGTVRMRQFDCTIFDNQGKLTTDSSGNLTCANDNNSGSGGSGGSSQFTRGIGDYLYPLTPTTTKIVLGGGAGGGYTSANAKIVINPYIKSGGVEYEASYIEINDAASGVGSPINDGSNQSNFNSFYSKRVSPGVTGDAPGIASFYSIIDPSSNDGSGTLLAGSVSVFTDANGSGIKAHHVTLDLSDDIPYDYGCAGICDFGSLNAMGLTNGSDVNIFASDAGSGANGTGGKVVIHGGAKDGTGLTGIVALAVTNAGLPMGKVAIGKTTVAQNNLVEITGPVAIATSSGNVGIGLTNPSAKLEVNGAVVVGGSGQSSLTKGLIVNNGQGNATTDDFTAKGTSDAMALHLEASSNRTGFGITTPTAKVDISGLTAEIKLRVSGAPLQGTTPLLQVQQYGSVDVLTAATGGAKVTGGLAVTNLPSCTAVKTDSSGIMSCGTGGGSGTPGGSNTQIQYNSSSTFAGDAGLVYDDTNDKVTITGSADSNHLVITNNATQTTDSLVVEKSGGTDIFTVATAGVKVTGLANISGNVGIGSTNPTAKLAVIGNTTTTALKVNDGANDIMTAATGGAKVTGTLTVTDTGATGSCIQLTDSSSTVYNLKVVGAALSLTTGGCN